MYKKNGDHLAELQFYNTLELQQLINKVNEKL